MKTGFKKTFKTYLSDDSGATAIEYGLLAALIAIAAIGGMNALGGGNAGAWGKMADKVDTVMKP